MESKATRTSDFRSDTITTPTKAMYEAILSAKLGDDILGDDPTVKQLEKLAAKIFKKEDCVFLNSGSQANLIACMCWCKSRSSAFIAGDRSHWLNFEQGSGSAVACACPVPLSNAKDGTIPLPLIKAAFMDHSPSSTISNIHKPVIEALFLECTHNFCGGTVLPRDYINAVGLLCHEYRAALHIDGARIMNAAVALGCPVADLVEAADSVTLCLSKALASPMGAVLVGSKDFIDSARRCKQLLGGGMRQGGIVAAPCIVSLTEMVDRLAEDHANARQLAQELAKIEGVEIDLPMVHSNIVVATVKNAPAIAERLEKEHQVRIFALDDSTIRFVTHYQVDEEDVRAAVRAMHSVMTP